MAPLAPTAPNPLAGHYGRPGGPWDHPTLDTLLRTAFGSQQSTSDDGGPGWNPGRLDAEVARVAGGLVDRGVGRGDVVSWSAPPSTASVVIYRACWRVGATAAPIHHRASERERDTLLRRLAPRLVVDADRPPEGPPMTDDQARADDVAVVVFTSGSSGRPKGVLHTHRTLAYKVCTMIDVHDLTPDDAVLMPAPVAHISGLLNGVLVPAAVPMRAVVFMSRWDTARALDLIEHHRITFMVGPPTFFVGLLEDPGFSPTRVASLRLVSSGGAGVTPAFVEEASARFGCVVKRTYGSTEAPTVTTTRASDDPRRRSTSDGRTTGQAELRVVDPRSGADRPATTEGEVWVRGPELFGGYLDRGDNDGAFVDGWFRTGDLARLDAEGWLTVTGRLKEVIIRAGENIAASEVEQTLEAHPAVLQAVVVGEPDDRLGERVVAVVVTSGPFDLDACREWFVQEGIALFKTPERVVVVESLPSLASGKPDRAAVRARL